MFHEDDLVPVSALQHLVFCERQCALIHIEQVWRDNPLTVEGSHLHERAHETAPRRELRGDLLIARGVPLRSLRLGLSGRADVVEFHRRSSADGPSRLLDALQLAICLPGLPGEWAPYPVEYKRGKPKPERCDEVQLCAQAMCLEEMLEVAVSDGALFYGAIQRRHNVRFTLDLRKATEEAALRLHELLRSEVTPRVNRAPKCRRCSLVDVCRPDVTAPQRSTRRSARRYTADVFARAIRGEAQGS